MPIISPHSHVPVSLLRQDQSFGNAAELFVIDDHYITRLLHAAGFQLADLRLDTGANPRAIWRRLISSWHLFEGTASGYWLEEELVGVLGVDPPGLPAVAKGTAV